MRSTMRRLALPVVSAAVCSLMCGGAMADTFVYRPEVALSGPLREELRWTASLEPQIPIDSRHDGEIALVGGLCWRPSAYLAVSPQFMYRRYDDDLGFTELRPRFDLEFFGPGELRRVGFRNRFEYRMKEAQDGYWRYRGRLKVKLPKCWDFTPFLYDEVFYEFGDKNELNGNEAGVGVTVPLADSLKLTVDFRVCHAISDGDWSTGNRHLLTTFEYSF